MLSSCEYELLSYIFENHSVSVQDIADHFGLEKLDRDTDAVLITLHSQGLIDMDFDRNCSILPAEVHALLMYNEKNIHIDAEAKNKAEHEKHSAIGAIQEHNERKRQSLIAIICLVISLLSFAFQFGDDLVALLKYFFAK